MTDYILTEGSDTIVTEAGDSLITDGLPVSNSCGFGIIEAKARLSITDSSKDVEIQGSIDASLQIVELYLDRKLILSDDVEYFYDVDGHTLQLRRYPVERIVSSSHSYDKVDKLKGTIHIGGVGSAHEVEVKYRGGYCPLPPALLTALWGVFDAVYAMSSGSGGAVTAGAIDSISIPDVGTIKYSSGGAAATPSAAGGPLASVAYILNPYKRWMA